MEIQESSGPEKISRKHIYTENKNFLVPLELQIRETYLQTYCTVEQPQTLSKKYIKIDKDMIMLQDNAKTVIKYKKPKPHGQSHTVSNRSAHQIRTTPVPMVGDGNVSRGTGATQTTIEIFTFAD